MEAILFESVEPIDDGTNRTLILDLDETAVHSYENPEFIDRYGIYSDPETSRKFHPLGVPQVAYSMFLVLPNGALSRTWGLYRPNIYEFLRFAKGYFRNIIVWSAGIDPYVNEIVKGLFLESGLPTPKVVWCRSNCSIYQDIYHKPIHDLITYISNSPHSTLKIDPKWTIIVDDRLHTFMQNPNSGVLIPPYHPGNNRPGKIPTMEDLLDRSDDALLKLMEWLKRPEVMHAPDIRDMDKTKIF